MRVQEDLTPPQMYGLPKIHKDGISLCPIVSAIGSPTYSLAKKVHVAGILFSLSGLTDHELYVKKSSDFAQQVRDTDIQHGEMMISFDVVSLFTKVPVDDALQAISTLLTQDVPLNERTTIPVSDICMLTKLCLRSTYLGV